MFVCFLETVAEGKMMRAQEDVRVDELHNLKDCGSFLYQNDFSSPQTAITDVPQQAKGKLIFDFSVTGWRLRLEERKKKD